MPISREQTGESWHSQAATLIKITSLSSAATRLDLRHYVVQTGQTENTLNDCIVLTCRTGPANRWTPGSESWLLRGVSVGGC